MRGFVWKAAETAGEQFRLLQRWEKHTLKRNTWLNMTLEISCQSESLTIELSELARPVREPPIMHWALGEVWGRELIARTMHRRKERCVWGIAILSERLVCVCVCVCVFLVSVLCVCVFMYGIANANPVFSPVGQAAVTICEDIKQQTEV